MAKIQKHDIRRVGLHRIIPVAQELPYGHSLYRIDSDVYFGIQRGCFRSYLRLTDLRLVLSRQQTHAKGGEQAASGLGDKNIR